jgi:inner membrane protein
MMQSQLSALGSSPLSKVAAIGILILIMLIPVSMTRGVIDDRSLHGEQARQDIMQSWGRQQTVGGPILVVPYSLVRTGPDGDRRERFGTVYFLPELLDTAVEMQSEIRQRGVHEVPVYTAAMSLTGRFAAVDTSRLGIDGATLAWSRAVIALPLSDARAVRNSPEIVLGEATARFSAGGSRVTGFENQIIAPVAFLQNDAARSASLAFSLDIDLAGTERMHFLPLGDVTRVSARSDWSSPSFSGAYLPEQREIGEDGFTAEWRLSNLGRALPSSWTAESFQDPTIMGTAFGVDLFVPIGLYQQTDRATKYAVLFIGLTFVAFFLFEVLQRLRLHPLQYLLVGLANALFYLLLLSVAEHTGFGPAYLLSAVASTGLISGYSATILGGWRKSMPVAALLVLLYAFLYLTLNAETYAMLAGSIALWIGLGSVMYLTRNIDWYSLSRQKAPDQSELFAGS